MYWWIHLSTAALKAALDRQIVNPEFLEFAFPPRYHYDVLRALDYFKNANVQSEARIRDAVHIIESRRQADGRCSSIARTTRRSPSRWASSRAGRVGGTRSSLCGSSVGTSDEAFVSATSPRPR